MAEYTEAEARAWIEKHGVVNVGHTRRDVAGKREMLATWDTLVAERDRLRRFYDAYQLCDGHRGAFSCIEAHDCRCPKARTASPDQWRGVWECVCGREELDAAETAVTALARPEGTDG
jgi:hypothetical protein